MIKGLTTLMVMMALMLGAVAFAQDATPTADPAAGQQDAAQQEGGSLFVGDITGDPATYAGQTVTIQGTVNELVNIRSFLLGQDEGQVGDVAGDSQLLVLNNSGQEFNIGLSTGAPVMVTGVIYPSASEGGWDQLMAELEAGTAGQQQNAQQATPTMEGGAEATPAMEGEGQMATATPMAGGQAGGQTGGGVGLTEYPTSLFTDRFPDHTILLVNSIEDIQFVETEEQQ